MAGTKPLFEKFAVEGLLLSSVSAPFEKARLLVLLQQQHVPPPQRVRGSPRPTPRLNKHEDVMQMLFKLAQQHGILSLWCDFLSHFCSFWLILCTRRGNLLRVIEYAGFFLLYRLAPRLERFVVRHERKDVWKFYSEQTLFGVLMHTAYFLLLSPLHLVATRLSVDIRKPNRYAGIIDCVTQTVKTVPKSNKLQHSLTNFMTGRGRRLVQRVRCKNIASSGISDFILGAILGSTTFIPHTVVSALCTYSHNRFCRGYVSSSLVILTICSN